MPISIDTEAAVLPVARAPAYRRLVDAAGRPVWPVDDETLRVLTRAAAGFGFSVREVVASDAQHKPAGEGLVVAVGGSCAAAARLYAHLTDRSWTLVDGVEDLPHPGCFDMLVTNERCLSSPLLDMLYAPGLGAAPGLLYAADDESLYVQVLVRSAVTALSGAPGSRRIDIRPTPEVARTALPHRAAESTVLGPGSTRQELVAALTTGATVLTVVTHSDGLDADFGPDLVMCPIDDDWRRRDTELAPACRHNGQCYRLKRSIGDLNGSDELFHPARVSARAFIFDACGVVMPTDSTTDPEFGLAAHLARSPGIGALITSWRPMLGTPDGADGLARQLVSGVPVGIALAIHNTTQDSLGTGHRLCLFGDPALRVAPQDGPPPSIAGGGRPPGVSAPGLRPSRRWTRSPESSQLPLLKACLTAEDRPRPGSSPALGTMADALGLAVAAIEACEASCDGDTVERERLEAQMRRAVVDVIAQRGRLFDVWVRYAVGSELIELTTRCDGCSNSTERYEVELGLGGIEPRMLEICPRCGFTRDTPAGFKVGMQVGSDGVAHLCCDVGDEPWAGALTTQYRWPLPTSTWVWPAGPTGAPALTVSLPERLEPVPLVVTATLVVGTRLLVASRGLRGVMQGGNMAGHGLAPR